MIRLTYAALKTLRFLLLAKGDCSGAAITRGTGIPSGTLYPLLSRLERESWVRGKWENVEPKKVGRPRQRFFTLTVFGRRETYVILKTLQLP